MTWVVRLPTESGRVYVHRAASILGNGTIADCALTTAQTRARRFELRALASRYAAAFGGRVVRLVPRRVGP